MDSDQENIFEELSAPPLPAMARDDAVSQFRVAGGARLAGVCFATLQSLCLPASSRKGLATFLGLATEARGSSDVPSLRGVSRETEGPGVGKRVMCKH